MPSEAKGNTKPGPTKWMRSKRFILISIFAIIVLSLALGLGLGLGLKNDDDDDDDESGEDGSTGEIWQPDVGAKWQIVLLKPVEVDSDNPILTPDVDVWDIDMYTNSKDTISAIKKLGKKVICYFSAGSYEDFRPDSDQFDSGDIGAELDGWPGEYWLNISSPTVRSIMSKRIEYAKNKGCDAIDPDNVDGYQNENGLGLTANDSIDFMRFIASEAAELGMASGLKNAGDIITDLLDVVQFSVNEQCVEYSECGTFAQFIKSDKPVFQIEYPEGTPSSVDTTTVDTICSRLGDANGSTNFSTVIKDMSLDGWVQ